MTSEEKQRTGWGRRAYGSQRYGKDDPYFEVEITETNSPVEAGDTVEVDVDVVNRGGSGDQTLDLTIEEQ